MVTYIIVHQDQRENFKSLGLPGATLKKHICFPHSTLHFSNGPVDRGISKKIISDNRNAAFI
jgi:hypothetical protein